MTQSKMSKLLFSVLMTAVVCACSTNNNTPKDEDGPISLKFDPSKPSALEQSVKAGYFANGEIAVPLSADQQDQFIKAMKASSLANGAAYKVASKNVSSNQNDGTMNLNPAEVRKLALCYRISTSKLT